MVGPCWTWSSVTKVARRMSLIAAEYQSLLNGCQGFLNLRIGCASVLKMTLSKSSVSGGEKSREKYLKVSAKRKLCIEPDFSFVVTFFRAAYPSSVRQYLTKSRHSCWPIST